MPEGWCFSLQAEVLVPTMGNAMWDTGTNWPASAGSWLVHLRSIGIGYGYGVAKEVPKGETWA